MPIEDERYRALADLSFEHYSEARCVAVLRQEIVRLREGLQLMVVDEHRLMNTTARRTADSILSGKPIHSPDTTEGSRNG